MFSTASKFIAGTQQKVIAWFEPGEDSNVFDQVTKDFEKDIQNAKVAAWRYGDCI